MKRLQTRAALLSTSSLLVALACNGGGEKSELSQSHGALADGKLPAGAQPRAADEDEEEANDKVVCAVDTDCDSDEVCSNGRCTDPPGAVADDDDGADDDEADDDGPGDKLVCSVDADCDSDEVCNNGRCADPPGHQNACGADDDDDEDDEADEGDGPGDKLVCSADTDCDSDEVCSNGRCR